MFAKFLFIALALLNGGWMLFDGIHVLVKGKYFGPPEPGPWSKIVTKVGLNPFSLGPLFIVLGGFWIVVAIAIYFELAWASPLGLVVAIATLWYAPVGTVISIVAIALLLFFLT